MRRLWVQQTLAFSVVVIFTMTAVVFLINRGADKEFRKYITFNQMRWSEQGLYELVEHYQRQGSWEGVEKLLAQGVFYSDERRGVFLLSTYPELEQFAQDEKELQPDVILADASGRIVFASRFSTPSQLPCR